MIHCGVSSLAECITLETRAVCHKNLYTKPDIYGQLPNGVDINHIICDKTKSQEFEANECQCIESGINLEKVCDRVNQHFQSGAIKMPAVLSSNAGRSVILVACSFHFNEQNMKIDFGIENNFDLYQNVIQISLRIYIPVFFGEQRRENCFHSRTGHHRQLSS